LALRNLCEDNADVQSYITSLKPQGIAENVDLAELGFKAEYNDQGKLVITHVDSK